MDYVLILVALVFISASQILQKVAAVNADKKPAGTHFLRRLAARKETWWAIISLGTGTLFWLAALAKYELSMAYPLLSLSYVLVYIGAASWPRLHETVSALKTIGIILILAGVFLVTRTQSNSRNNSRESCG